jgi:Uma2 family endonuclease
MSSLASKSSETSGSEWSLDSVEHLVLDGVSWELYEHLLKVVGDRPLRLTYDQGELEIMSPLPEHEVAKSAIANFVRAIAEELDLPRADLGSTTFRRRLEKRGLEPDDCFYIQNQPKVIGKKRFNLPKDPPPDLVIEIEITSRVIPRLPIYASLGVPEIWRYNGRTLSCLLLNGENYVESSHGKAFPDLRVADLRPFIRIAEEKSDQTAAVKALRAWLRKQTWARR